MAIDLRLIVREVLAGTKTRAVQELTEMVLREIPDDEGWNALEQALPNFISNELTRISHSARHGKLVGSAPAFEPVRHSDGRILAVSQARTREKNAARQERFNELLGVWLRNACVFMSSATAKDLKVEEDYRRSLASANVREADWFAFTAQTLSAHKGAATVGDLSTRELADILQQQPTPILPRPARPRKLQPEAPQALPVARRK